MLLKYFYDKALAQASYLVGCEGSGQALVIDPMRHIQPYLEAAQAEGVQITHITETHIHADFASGAHELAAATGATLYLSDMGNAEWKYTYPPQLPVVKVHDGDSWRVGSILIQALHTPGHTPEHLSFLVTDTASADRPLGLFTGDFIFVGDVGRPDLLEEAAGMVGTREVGAAQQFQSLQAIQNQPDYLQLWPGHGAGSACGKALGAMPSSTLGYEKLFGPAFQFQEQAAFCAWLLAGQPEAPRYFAQMKRINKQGWPLLADLVHPRWGKAQDLDDLLAQQALVVDFRPRPAYAHNHRLGTLSIPASSSNFSTYVGWFVDYQRPLYMIVDEGQDVAAIVRDLRAIGVDDTPLYFTPDAWETGQTLPQVSLSELHALPHALIVDVRGQSEYDQIHIPNALNIPLGHLPRHLEGLPQERPIILQCASGYRSQIATTYLLGQGFRNVYNLTAPQSEWAALAL